MDVITLGESMVLLTSESAGPLRYNHRFHKSLAGAESNVAIALSRLGHQVGWMSKLGNDEFGIYVRNTIRGEGVDTSEVTFDSSAQTGVLFKEIALNKDPRVFYYRNDSAASKLSIQDLNNNYLKSAKYVHVTGITPALSKSCEELIDKMIDIAKDNGQTVVFDPNVRLKLWSEEKMQHTLLHLASKSDIVMPGIEEGTMLTGEHDVELIAESLLANGAKLVIIKLGAKGAYFTDGNISKHVPGYKVTNVVDTVGAGDGFAAGVISGLLREWDYESCVKLGNKIGAHALQVRGDYEGYPYWDELQTTSPITR